MVDTGQLEVEQVVVGYLVEDLVEPAARPLMYKWHEGMLLKLTTPFHLLSSMTLKLQVVPVDKSPRPVAPVMVETMETKSWYQCSS
jgi:hypothetical protein